MTFKPNPRQALFLWGMIVGETPEAREPTLTVAGKQLRNVEERDRLIEEGFLKSQKRGRSTVLILQEGAVTWAMSTPAVELPKEHPASRALQGVLRRLIPYLSANDIPLGVLLGSTSVRLAPELSAQIESACLGLAGGRRKERVRLSALRERLPAISRDVLDRVLIEMQRAKRLVLYRDDHTSALTPADHEAALVVGDAPRHLVYLED